MLLPETNLTFDPPARLCSFDNFHQFVLMRTALWILFVQWLISSTAMGQEIRLKGLVIPLFEHSVAGEYVFHRNFSFQLAYQQHIELGDNTYYHHRVLPSVRFYIASNRSLFDRIYGEVFHRSTFIRHIPDQSDVSLIKYNSQSAGFSLGKQVLFRSRNMFMDFSLGRYFIYQGNSQIDRPGFDLFIQGEKGRIRLDFKLGFRLNARKKA